MARIILAIITSLISSYLVAQPEVRKLSLYDMKGDVYYFIEKQYKARMAFGELEKGDLLETDYYRFDENGNLIYHENEKDDKKTYSKYSYNKQNQLINIFNSDYSQTVFQYTGKQLIQCDEYDKEDHLESRIKRTYQSPSNFVDIRYNKDGKETYRFFYRNNLHTLTKSGENTTTISYNELGKEVRSKFVGKEYDYNGNALTFYWDLVRDGTLNLTSKNVTSLTQTYYNVKGLPNKIVKSKNGTNTDIISFEYEYDSKGNWIKRIANYSGPKLDKLNLDEFIIIFEREIVYYSNAGSKLQNTSLTDIQNAEDAIKYATNLPDRMPSFPGGGEEMYKYIGQHVHYPAICQENGIQGKVILQFTVTRDGGIKNIKVVEGVNPNLDKAAMEVFTRMPKWDPAVSKGQFVDELYTVPVVFKLIKEQKN